MPTTQTIRRLPPTRHAQLPAEMVYWELETQQVSPLRTVDTSAASYAENTPNAGLNSSTGQTNQNQELTYIKTSSDANVFTLHGVEGGALMLHDQLDVIKIKSDGSSWWPVG